MDADGLRSVRNAFYLGFYQQAITEAKSLQNNTTLTSWANIFHHRALAAIAPEQVFQAIPQNASTALQSIKQYATYKTAAHDNRELVLDTIKEWLADEEMAKDITLQLMAAHIYVEQGMLKEALKIVTQQAAENLEKLSMCVSIYLTIDRIDLALKSYKQMQDIDDDDTLTQLAGAWCGIAQGGEKLSEAQSLLEELSEKFGPSVAVLNSLAVCAIKSKNYSESLSSLKQARELAVENKTKVAPETLINYIVALQHLRKTEIIPKVVAELRSSWPNHPFLTKYAELESAFDKNATTYKFKA